MKYLKRCKSNCIVSKGTIYLLRHFIEKQWNDHQVTLYAVSSFYSTIQVQFDGKY